MANKQKNSKSTSRISRARKLEITGILIIAIAVLVAMSIATYQQSDYALIQTLSIDQVFSVSKGPALRVHNSLGVVGAYLSHFFVYTLFGYVSMLVPAILFLYGWHLFRRKTITGLTGTALYVTWCMILISTILGWVNNQFQLLPIEWNGAAGVALARILQNVTGVGSIVILGVLLIVTLLMVTQSDLQWSIDGIKLKMADIGDAIANFFSRQKKKRTAESGSEKSADTIKEPAAGVYEEEASRKSKGRDSGESSGNGQSYSPIQKNEEKSSYVNRKQPETQSAPTSQSASEEQVVSGDASEVHEIKGQQGQDEGEEDVDMSVYIGEGEEEADKKELEKQHRSKSKEAPSIKYRFPKVDLLDSPPSEDSEVDMEEIKRNKSIILDKLERHNIEIESINAIVGPTVTLYELQPSPDVKISKIESYANDLKMATAAHGLRIIAPIPGRSAVGIEIPNSERETVYAKSVINTKKFVNTDKELPIALGKTIQNEVFMIDLTKLPHLLIAGATGSGKTVGINNLITCLLYKCHPDNLKFVLIDPKKIELSLYRNIKNHFLATLPDADEPIVTDTSEALETLNSLCMEMDERYELLKKGMVRDIRAYNEKYKAGELDAEDDDHRHLPYIVVVIDELADLMMTAGKQIEEPITRLAQLARAVGIHLVVATQRPSVNVITGTIKANFPARIAYQVASRVDSRTILDTKGADQLVGNGDMLYTNGGGMTRLQNAFVSTEEVERITEFIGDQQGYETPYELPVEEEEEASGIPDPLDDKDELFEDAAKLVVMHQQGSVSLLQRKLKLGYNRAGRIIDQLYAAGVVGPYQGSTAREVLCEDEEELQEKLAELDD